MELFSIILIFFSDAEKLLLVKGLWFSLPPKKPNYADYLTNFELFYRNIRNSDVLSNGDLDFVKTKIKDDALNSFRFCNANVPQNLFDEEFKALEKLSKNNIFVVQKANKSSSVVLVNRDVYVNHIENILKNKSKFEKVDIKSGIWTVPRRTFPQRTVPRRHFLDGQFPEGQFSEGQFPERTNPRTDISTTDSSPNDISPNGGRFKVGLIYVFLAPKKIHFH